MSNRELIERLRSADDLLDEHGVLSLLPVSLAVKRAIEAMEAHEWRTDMENAPRDGTHIMSMCGDAWPVSVYWQAYSPEDAAEAGVPGYWDYSDDLLSMHVDDVEPTHWKPLDTPPPSAEGSER